MMSLELVRAAEWTCPAGSFFHFSKLPLLIMAHDKLKALLDSGILQKITADKATYDKVVNGTPADVKEFAKSINMDLSDEAAATALALSTATLVSADLSS